MPCTLRPCNAPGHLRIRRLPEETPASEAPRSNFPLLPSSVPHEPPHLQVRPRLVDVETETEREGSCTVRVTLALQEGEPAMAEARGHIVPETQVRAGALATLQALSGLLPDDIQLELRGTKSVRAFDSSVIIAAVRTRLPEGRRDLIGAVAAPEDDPARGGALAALVAVNRLVSAKLADPTADSSR